MTATPTAQPTTPAPTSAPADKPTIWLASPRRSPRGRDLGLGDRLDATEVKVVTQGKSKTVRSCPTTVAR